MPATPDQLARRVRQLDLYRPPGGTDLDATTRAALHKMWGAGGSPPAIVVRSSFIALARQLRGPLTDRARPGPEMYPPLMRLPSPRGAALRTELIALFVAQCGPRGRSRVREMRLEPQDDELGWRHLILTPAVHRAGTVRAMTPGDNRVRQIKSAFDRLAEPEVGLVELPGAGTARARYDEVRLLSEVGARETGVAPRWSMPGSGETVVAVPAKFFLNGWVHVLTDAEIAAWLMFRHCTDSGLAVLSGEERLARYGLPLSTWNKHRELERFALMRHVADINRREDGTVEDVRVHGQGLLHRFAMTDDGLDAVAFDCVRYVLTRRV